MKYIASLAVFFVLCGLVSSACKKDQYDVFSRECQALVVEKVGSLAHISDPQELREPICQAVNMLELCHLVSARVTSCHEGPVIRELEESVRVTKEWLRENRYVEC
ncbi:uncharacterized protein LOC111636511 [Centruroides sculpturatus]|uniref:uncharacterized protein LOC111636511 n=1 Tax=Centruroides sculpturatus TaxID=218467 RepID=UPI000C6E9D3A|nr:uncharacterized protein LOC111636511 [Centruroides sculpturatus]